MDSKIPQPYEIALKAFGTPLDYDPKDRPAFEVWKDERYAVNALKDQLNDFLDYFESHRMELMDIENNVRAQIRSLDTQIRHLKDLLNNN